MRCRSTGVAHRVEEQLAATASGRRGVVMKRFLHSMPALTLGLVFILAAMVTPVVIGMA